MESFERSANKQEGLIGSIAQRATAASPKIQERINTEFIPKFEKLGSDYAPRWLGGVRNEFDAIAENPNAGGDIYAGWTADEVKELYYVLFGETMDG